MKRGMQNSIVLNRRRLSYDLPTKEDNKIKIENLSVDSTKNEDSSLIKDDSSFKENEKNDNKIISSSKSKTGADPVKKVTFSEEPEIIFVESYKKYNKIQFSESCCDCIVF